MTRDFKLNQEWTEIAEGPTTESLFIEAALRDVIFRIDSDLPDSSFGHRLDSDNRGQNLTLNTNDKLYAKAVESSAQIVLTGE